MMASSSVPDIIPEIKKWLEADWEKITSFILYADWRMWARFDLYAHLVKSFGSKASHSVPVWGDDAGVEADLAVDATGQGSKPVAVWICAQRANENDTSFPDFVAKFRREWEQVRNLTAKRAGEGDYEGGKLLFLGLGEKAYDDELAEFGGLKPACFGFGGGSEYEATLYAYYLWLDLDEAKE